jgi:hypothetical protein
MKRQAAAFLREQKRLIRRRQAAMHKAREEWQRNAEILDDVYPNAERSELMRVLTQVWFLYRIEAHFYHQTRSQLNAGASNAGRPGKTSQPGCRAARCYEGEARRRKLSRSIITSKEQ